MNNVDFCKRDQRKALHAESSNIFVLQQFGLFLGSFLLGLPIAVVTGGVSFVVNILINNNKSKSIGKKFYFPVVSPPLVSNIKPLSEREFDLILYGATGFTGGLAARYLATQYGNSVKWAIAGRRLEALERVREECYQLNSNLKDLTIIQVDSSNDTQLQEMCSRTRVVVTTVGPYQLYGTPLVRACIAVGTSCCDTAGEFDWYCGIIENYDAIARQNGCKIVSFCGHDAVPWDLQTFLMAQRLGTTEKLASIVFLDEAIFIPSGGTVATMLETIRDPFVLKSSKLKFAPHLMNEKGEKSNHQLRNRSSALPGKSPLDGQWGGPFFLMSMVNAQVVSRSNALNGYGENLTYMESRLGRSFLTILGRYLQIGTLLPIILLPPAFRNLFFPKPGEGPSKEVMDKGFLQVTAIGTGERGTKVGGRIYYPTDAVYRGTARMLVETGLTIALSPEKCTQSGGVLTPGSCCAQGLFERLLQTGTEYSYITF